MSKGVLVDITKCIGCGSCVVACKLWNERKFDDKNPGVAETPILNDHNWTTVSQKRVEKDGEEVWRFTKKQCLHCLQPACKVVCFSKSFKVTDEGAVVYNPKLCVGCRYCMLSCPFEIPKYEWDRVLPNVVKCQMCHSKITNGESPACIGVCPTDALEFGDREELLAKAKAKIKENNSYVNHVYGEKEAGGTSWMYISDVPFDKVGLPTNITHRPIPNYVKDFTQWVPHMFIGGGALLAGLSFYTKRRNKLEGSKDNDKG
ncbi:formate dehydrogenase iron-sulfur subunit [Desulfitispora alkaliphila]|uniref:4Fe-4S dicluster domain-containing protein n=1 Tax=Desulfitispora alkaliphila TaxID=622674 RepID=UPI003D206ACC